MKAVLIKGWLIISPPLIKGKIINTEKMWTAQNWITAKWRGERPSKITGCELPRQPYFRRVSMLRSWKKHKLKNSKSCSRNKLSRTSTMLLRLLKPITRNLSNKIQAPVFSIKVSDHRSRVHWSRSEWSQSAGGAKKRSDWTRWTTQFFRTGELFIKFEQVNSPEDRSPT